MSSRQRRHLSLTLLLGALLLGASGAGASVRARIVIDPGTGDIQTASTYTTGSFRIRNDSTNGERITRVRIDFSTAVLPDLVYDPLGGAGDVVGKDFTADDGATTTGLVSHTFLSPHDGGYDALEIVFNDFDPGEIFRFSVDADPTSVKGAAAPGPQDSASVSGLELVGSQVEVEFDDASLLTGEPWLVSGSDIASRGIFSTTTAPAPTVAIVGEPTLPATVTSAIQTVRVTGTPGATVHLAQLESGLFLQGVPNGGFDIDPYESNSVVSVAEYTAVLDGSGNADFLVALTSEGAESGYNLFLATQLDATATPGHVSATALLLYQPGTPPPPTGPLRFNVNGPTVSGVDFPGTWQSDPGTGGICAGSVFSTTSAIQGTVDDALFQGEVFGAPLTCAIGGGALPPGQYEVNLLFGEIYYGSDCPGGVPTPSPRLFDVALEGTTVETDVDLLAEGGCVASPTDTSAHPVVHSYTVDVLDGTLDISLPPTVDNAKLSAVEVIPLNQADVLGASPVSLDFGQVLVGNTSSPQTVTLSNLGTSGDPDVTVSDVVPAGDFTTSFSGPVVLPPGGSTNFDVFFAPTSAGTAGAALQVSHDGINTNLSVAVQGEGIDPGAPPISFTKHQLQGATGLQSPTSLQFGPDGRLYVAEQRGRIHAYTVQRTAQGDYTVVGDEVIDLVRQIPNHDDGGAVNAAQTDRQVTGLLVTGTPSAPRLYVSSSDPRIGAGTSGTDSGLDTNSGVVSRLDLVSSTWTRLDLVRGLPRSEENHSVNGLALDMNTNTLYLAVGGNTNMGAPSHNFAFLPEYALSSAILSIDLNAIGNSTYDLPTLDDEDRPGNPDANDPFGGNNGKNQAILVPGGPVQVYASGFRNPYDVLLTTAGRMYTVDNGPNAGWGDMPAGEGTPSCTNAVNEPGVTFNDQLQYVTGAGFYGGHPNPTRANTANTFNASNPQSPVSMGDPAQCDYRVPGLNDGALVTFPFSTNGLTEYRASDFGGALQGNLLAASFGDTIERVVLDAAGSNVLLSESLFTSAGPTPLDVTAQGDSDIFPGTIWVAVYGANAIDAYEPATGSACTGANDPLLDEDGDGYTNADEIANGTNPCSAADVPPDADGDFISDLNDPDDDNDGVPDTSDPYAVDPDNGLTTTLPVTLSFDNNQTARTGLLGLGFTGLMTNGTSDYRTLFDPTKMTAGGAAGVTTVDEVSAGDAADAQNTQEYGFQLGLGVGPSSGRFTVHARVLAPFSGLTPAGQEAMGIQLGTGDQDDYAKIVVTAGGGTPGILFGTEIGGVLVTRPVSPVALPGPDAVDLYLEVDPSAHTVTPSYSLTVGGTLQPRQSLGGAETLPAGWLDGTNALAMGLISTSAGGMPFPATWDFIEAVPVKKKQQCGLGVELALVLPAAWMLRRRRARRRRADGP